MRIAPQLTRWFMFGKHDYVWRALVWVMIPFTLAASLPRMHCRCAAARGLICCECCFQSGSDELSSSGPPVSKCCCHKQFKEEQAVLKPLVAASSHSDCPICPQITDPKGGSCCSWTSAVLSAPGESVTPAVPTDVLNWGFPLDGDTASVLASLAQHDMASHGLPPLDRITVFQHLVI